MEFCEKCGYIFNITKEVKRKQIGGKINKSLSRIFDKFENREKITEKDLKKIKGNDIIEDERYEEMNKQNKKKLMTAIKEVNETFFDDNESTDNDVKSNVAYYICTFCNNYRKIEPGSNIYSKKYDASVISEDENYEAIIYDNTLPRTRNYICPNKKCGSNKDDSKKEAVITKNTNYQTVYVCASCGTHWINTY